MRVVTPLDLRRSLGAILDAASAGERIVIERDHRPLAMLVSIEDGRRLDPDADEVRRRRLAALDRIDDFRRRMAIAHPPQPGDPDAVEVIRQMRSRDDPDGYPEYEEDDPERARRWRERYRAEEAAAREASEDLGRD
ncbi:MAG TPA: type II toxin-antitoxin system Phd/YefM family antitoxin [Patescibacteria group bacterium]|nr:type II toxin-antitoxin system Phd/YefM family antitoxin [Patescibacteria group bacterium]